MGSILTLFIVIRSLLYCLELLWASIGRLLVGRLAWSSWCLYWSVCWKAFEFVCLWWLLLPDWTNKSLSNGLSPTSISKGIHKRSLECLTHPEPIWALTSLKHSEEEDFIANDVVPIANFKLATNFSWPFTTSKHIQETTTS